MNFNSFAKKVRALSVWGEYWEDSVGVTEGVSFIHLEWSKALEAFRSGEQWVWYRCGDDDRGIRCEEENCGVHNDGTCSLGKKSNRPEGIAVHLIDGCLRLLDACAGLGVFIPDDPCISDELCDYIRNWTIPTLVSNLHERTSAFWTQMNDRSATAAFLLACVFTFLTSRGVNPEELLKEKYTYLKSRA